MLVVIRDGEKLSLKSSFVVQLFGSSLNLQIIRVSRKESKKFSEQWNSNKIDLATSTSGILAYFLLMPLKSPRNLRDGVLRRLSVKQSSYVLVTRRFLIRPFTSLALLFCNIFTYRWAYALFEKNEIIKNLLNR